MINFINPTIFSLFLLPIFSSNEKPKVPIVSLSVPSMYDLILFQMPFKKDINGMNEQDVAPQIFRFDGSSPVEIIVNLGQKKLNINRAGVNSLKIGQKFHSTYFFHFARGLISEEGNFSKGADFNTAFILPGFININFTATKGQLVVSGTVSSTLNLSFMESGAKTFTVVPKTEYWNVTRGYGLNPIK